MDSDLMTSISLTVSHNVKLSKAQNIYHCFGAWKWYVTEFISKITSKFISKFSVSRLCSILLSHSYKLLEN